MFVALSFSQSVSVLYNVFYDSKDLKDYLPLPFQRSSVFFAKFLIVALTVFPFLLPILGLFIITTIRSGLPILLALSLSLLLFLLFFLLSFSFSALVVSFLVQSKAFNQRKNLYTTLLMLLPSVGMALGMVYLNSRSAMYSSGTAMTDQQVIYLFYPFYNMVTAPFTLASLLSLVTCLLVLLAFYWIIRKSTIPKMYQFAAGENKQPLPAAAKKALRYEGLERQLFKYNFGLIKNPTLLMQVFTSIFLVPVLMILPNIMNGMMRFDNIPTKFFAVGLVIGIVYALFTIGPTSISGLIISLDRENYLAIMAMPLSMKTYLKNKFRFALLVQLLLTSLSVLLVTVITKTAPLLILAVLLGNVAGNYLGTAYYFYRDYRLLTLNWTTVSQLFNRGGGNFAVIVSLFGTLIVGGIVIAAVVGAVMFTPYALAVNLLLLILIAALTVGCHYHYRRILWDKKADSLS